MATTLSRTQHRYVDSLPAELRSAWLFFTLPTPPTNYRLPDSLFYAQSLPLQTPNTPTISPQLCFARSDQTQPLNP